MTNFEPSWQKELTNSFTEPEKLLQFLQISSKNYQSGFAARRLFALRVPKPFAERMRKGDENDPLFLQVITRSDELIETQGYVADPLMEHDSVIPGLLHKYQSRVLMMVKTGCAVNCRYCFRRHFPYPDNSLNKKGWQQVIEYVKNDKKINEVILSGGDPLMAKDEHLIELLNLLADVPHITRVRIHTRLPVVIPSRITLALSTFFAECRLKIIIVLHINHANEIDGILSKALTHWQSANITLLNQAVLLKDINDSLSAQVDLAEQLFAVGVLPYYLHVCDKVQNAAHFDTQTADNEKLYQAMLAALPGFLMAKWVREEGGKASKTPINYIHLD